MTTPAGPPPMCGSCGAYLQPPNTNCAVCGKSQWPQQPPVYIPHAPPATGHPAQYAQPGYGPPAPMGGVVTAKSPGVAVLLSFLWLGAGNLYAGQTALGIVLILVNFPLWIFALTFIGMIIAFPVWVVLAIVGMVLAAQGAKDFNLRNGIVVR
ncbi:hypothetical protein [Saccharothrix algeriensis]|uniref:TM2 domain-containing membrane protein YozV n=1 Tax=Saccharothrix algeriensis TaxID=173560 RepID=A0ABS2S9F2_9PSEU|nr:hypothetical protein [Saccharothrix algeriensis]MBM7812885.1 TM2 domain-containing membrane protein YozV [Saccharothrix algeriensis]